MTTSREAADARTASLMNSLHRRPLVAAPVLDVAQVEPQPEAQVVAEPRCSRLRRAMRDALDGDALMICHAVPPVATVRRLSEVGMLQAVPMNRTAAADDARGASVAATHTMKTLTHQLVKVFVNTDAGTVNEHTQCN